MIFRYHLFRLFFWGVSSIIGTGRTVLFPLIIALFSGTATFVIATTGATSRVVFGRFSQFLGNRDFIDIPTQEIFNSFELGLLFLTDKSNGATHHGWHELYGRCGVHNPRCHVVHRS